MTAKTVAQLLTEISSNLASGSNISAASLRQVMTDTVGSYYNTQAPPYNVQAFGATGNGVADDGPAFAATYAAVGSAGGMVYIPPGTYNLVTYAINPPSNTITQGSGIDSTIIKSTGTFPNNVTIQIPFTLTGLPWPSAPTTYPINATTMGATTITTTSAADAGNFSAGNIIFITGETHGTSFWYPGWYTTVLSANAGTGIITLAETLPINVGLTRCQKILNLPQNIQIRDMTIVSGSTAAIECQGGFGFLFENIKVIPGSGGVSTADVTFGIHKNTTVRNMRMEAGANPLELFVSNRCTIDGCYVHNGYILLDGGSFDCSVVNSCVKDAQNNGNASHGITLQDYALRNRIIGCTVTGIPNGLSGINVSANIDSNRNNVIMGNTLIGAGGAGGSGTGVSTSDGLVVGNFYSNLASGVQMQGGLSTPEVPILEGNYFDLASPNGSNINPFAQPSFFRTVQNPNIRPLSSGVASPIIQGGVPYQIAQSGAFSITGLTGGKPGDMVWISTQDGNTTFVNGNFQMKGGINYNAPNNTVLCFLCLTGGGLWIEVSRTQ